MTLNTWDWTMQLKGGGLSDIIIDSIISELYKAFNSADPLIIDSANHKSI